MGDKKESMETEKFEMSPMNGKTDGERGESGEERLSIDGGDNEHVIPENGRPTRVAKSSHLPIN